MLAVELALKNGSNGLRMAWDPLTNGASRRCSNKDPIWQVLRNSWASCTKSSPIVALQTLRNACNALHPPPVSSPPPAQSVRGCNPTSPCTAPCAAPCTHSLHRSLASLLGKPWEGRVRLTACARAHSGPSPRRVLSPLTRTSQHASRSQSCSQSRSRSMPPAHAHATIPASIPGFFIQ